MACDACGAKRGHLGGCPTQSGGSSSPAPERKSRKGRRTEVVDNVTKDAAEAWAKRMGLIVQDSGKKRHYEIEPDENNPGKVKLIFVEDE